MRDFDPEADVEAASLTMEQKETSAQVFKRMTPCRKEFFSWRYEEKGSFKQLEAQKGVSPAAVTKAYKRALAAMRRKAA
ncbi:hypothetical protein [Eubacterium limosum]|uniref:hypothetical protein n=1 Tax=Eubacterium limosum TaxID=1736 RepID=UPI0037238868